MGLPGYSLCICGSCLAEAATLEPLCPLDRNANTHLLLDEGAGPATRNPHYPGQEGGGASQLLRGRTCGGRNVSQEAWPGGWPKHRERPCGRVRTGDGSRLAGLPTVTARSAPVGLVEPSQDLDREQKPELQDKGGGHGQSTEMDGGAATLRRKSVPRSQPLDVSRRKHGIGS